MNRRILPLLLTGAVLLGAGLTLSACDLLEVDNPNSLIEEDLSNPSAATPMANGAEASLTRALGAILSPYSTATDELTWVGSRDSWQQLDFGNTDNVLNEFTDAAFPYVAEARWVIDNFADRLEAFRAEDALPNALPLARVYLYKGIIYTTIADMFDNFVFSNRTEPGMPIGRDQMVTLYDTAIEALDAGVALNASGNVLGQNINGVLMAMRARAKYSKAVWQKIKPTIDSADPLVSDAGAVADAQQALDLLGFSDWTYQLVLDGSVGALVVGDLSMALQVNDRLELRIGGTYVQPNDAGNKVDAVTFTDIIDTETVHPYLDTYITEFTADVQYADIPIVSAREMHLILAEAALDTDDSVTFATNINAVRDFDGLTLYTDQVDPQELLIQSRQVNLFLQGRRLADHYRFGIPAAEWIAEGTALQRFNSGSTCFLPVTSTEINANENVSEDEASC